MQDERSEFDRNRAVPSLQYGTAEDSRTWLGIPRWAVMLVLSVVFGVLFMLNDFHGTAKARAKAKLLQQRAMTQPVLPGR
ncbi:MAG: hypothetical protein H7Z14_04240 [Anaerolineae bacterium]|nr:hypothetical protein [Phycisphaerae bacterium]